MGTRTLIDSAVHAKHSPIAGWPVWKAIGLCIGGPALLGGMLSLSSLMVPPPLAVREVALFSLVMTLGVVFFVWSWRRYTWGSRVASTALVAIVFLAIGMRAWTAILGGIWLWVVVLLFAVLFCFAWFLPAVSPAASALIWREQSAPETRFGRVAMKWALRLGLGGAGVLGASAGMSIMRTGAAPVAYLIVALGASILAVLLSQSFSHQLWPDSPWARSVATSDPGKGG